MVRRLVLLLSLATVAAAQAGGPGAQPAPGPATQAASQSATQPATQSATRLDPARQMEQDLNHMESLLNNMAAETAFIKDTNMQILLNTNYQLWSILIRDLRLQMEQQKKAGIADPGPKPPTH